MLTILVSGMLVAPLLSCDSESDEAELPENTATVQRGNLTIDITAAGNLALSRTEDLAIDLFYQEGTVEEVLVEEGDTVEEEQLVVKLDTDEWEDELEVLEDAVTTAERQLTSKERDLVQAEVTLLTAEQNLKTSRDNQATKELAVLNAQISLDTAQNNLKAAVAIYDWEGYDAVEAALNRAEAWYEYMMRRSQDVSGDADNYLLALERAKDALDAAQTDYDNFVAGHDSDDISLRKKQIEAAEMSLASAQEDLADVAEDVIIKEQQVELNKAKLEDAQIAIEDAQGAIEDAQEALEEAQSKSSEITTPFAGFITMVNVEGGDEVLKGTVAVQLADPNKFEADILVSEMDILQVKIGGEAWVEVDAMPGVSLPAEVTHIAPTATIQSGVVNYEVKVEIESLEAVAREQQEARQQAMADIAAGQEAPATGQVPSMVPEDFQLREGLTVTVSIIVEERSNVLLVPNAAITTEGRQSYVQVVTSTGATEQRAIQTGISDYQFTEVTEGLSEGEQVIVPQGTVTTTTTEERRPAMGIFGPRPR